MAVTVTDHRTIWNEADSTSGWNGSPTLGTTDPAPIESTGWVGYNVGNETFDAYYTGTARALDDHIVYAWLFNRTALDTRANGGLQIHLGDGTNRVGFHVAGSDVAAFRHDSGPVGWQCLALDTASLPTANTVRAGTYAGLISSLTSSITQIGTIVKGLAAAPGMAPTYNCDIIRIFDPSTNDGCAVSITGGTSGDPGTFLQMVQADRLTGNQQAHGVIRELGSGAYGIQAPLRFGNATGTANSWFEDTNKTIVFEDRGFATTRYKIVIVDNGTGTTTFRLGTKQGTGTTATGINGCSLIVPPGVGGEFDAATDTDVTDVFLYGCPLSGWTNGIKLRSGHEFIGCSISGSGTFEPNGATCVNSRITTPTSNTALLWDVATNTNGLLDGMSISAGGGGCAIELGPNCPAAITLTDVTFTGFEGTPGTNGSENTGHANSAILNASGKAITITVAGGTNPAVRNTGSGSTTTVLTSPNYFTITNVIEDSEVRILLQSDLSELGGVENVSDTPTGVSNVTVAEDDNDATRFKITYEYQYSVDTPIYVVVFKEDHQAVYLSQTLRSTDGGTAVFQIFDRQYDNPA